MISDEAKKGAVFGRYRMQSFTFTPVMELPDLPIKSAETWIDAGAGRLYAASRGHLLSLPLPQ